MQLTKGSIQQIGHVLTNIRVPRPWALLGIVVSLLLTFGLDRITGNAHVEHLYYLPIVLAALTFGSTGGLLTALASVALYHLANYRLFAFGRADLIEAVLLIAAGLFIAKLSKDSLSLHALAMTDDLTGLHNLRSFEAGLAKLVKRAAKAHEPLSILVLDVDRLKSMNDRHGHLAGAEAVRTVGQIIAEQVPKDGLACRYGGDEFVIALPGWSEAKADGFAHRLRQAVNDRESVLAGHPFPAGTLSISVGLACYQGFEDADPELGRELFRTADEALYRAKSSGRNRVCVS